MTADSSRPSPSSQSRIAALNDEFRRTFVGGRVLLTPGVGTLADEHRAKLLTTVSSFSAFTPDNDPYSERDFGAIDTEGERFFWKIDYYNSDCTAGSDDPSDPMVTTRVLTVMRADEY